MGRLPALIPGKISARSSRTTRIFQDVLFSKQLLGTIGERLRIPPENTLRGTNRGTGGSFTDRSFFDAKVAFHCFTKFMVELHDIIGAGLNTAGSTHDAPVSFLYSHVLRKAGLNFIEGFNADSGF